MVPTPTSLEIYAKTPRKLPNVASKNKRDHLRMKFPHQASIFRRICWFPRGETKTLKIPTIDLSKIGFFNQDFPSHWLIHEKKNALLSIKYRLFKKGILISGFMKSSPNLTAAASSPKQPVVYPKWWLYSLYTLYTQLYIIPYNGNYLYLI